MSFTLIHPPLQIPTTVHTLHTLLSHIYIGTIWSSTMAQLTPIKGFTNTPVTRAICVLSTIVTILILILSIKPYFSLAIDPFIIQYSQYWRVATFQLSPMNESDFLICVVLWFEFKTLERFFGPKRYLLLIALFALFNAVVTFLVLSLGQLAIVGSWAMFRQLVMRLSLDTSYFTTIFNAVTPGPLGIISLLYVCHSYYVPVTYLFKLLLQKPQDSEAGDESTPSGSVESGAGAESNSDSNSLLAGGGTLGDSNGQPGLIFDVTLTSHFQVQILFTLLLLNHGFSSIIPCLVGVLMGKLYVLDLLVGSKTWAIPSFVFQLFVSPSKARQTLSTAISRRWRGYRAISENGASPPPTVMDDLVIIDDAEEDREMAIDDLRNQDADAAARSATPVRPLGRRFLDTFTT